MARDNKDSDTDNEDADGAYRTLFAQPDLVRQLLEAFAPAGIVKLLRLEDMEPIQTTFLTQALGRRHTDCIWEIPTLDDNPLYLCLVLEFQSSVDSFMAARVATYVSLLYEHLIQTQRKRLDQRLPPVLPIVLYNGEATWGANRSLANFIPMVVGSHLERYQLQIEYLLIDINALGEADKPSEPNLVSTLFDMEQASHHEGLGVVAIFDRLLRLTQEHPARVEMRRVFLIFFNGVLSKRGAQMPTGQLNDLMEVRTMFENIDQREQRRFEQGRLKGIEEGLREGVEKGLREGVEKGLREGVERVVLRLLASKFGVDEAAWKPRLAAMSQEQLDAFMQRALEATSESEL